jgi:hypothetical protein
MCAPAWGRWSGMREGWSQRVRLLGSQYLAWRDEGALQGVPSELGTYGAGLLVEFQFPKPP